MGQEQAIDIDLDCLHNLQAGKPDAPAQFVAHFQPVTKHAIAWMAWKQAAHIPHEICQDCVEDAVQHALLKSIENPSMLNPARSPRGFLITLAYRKALDEFKRVRKEYSRRVFVYRPLTEEERDDAERFEDQTARTASERIEQDEEVAAILEAIHQLPANQKTLVLMLVAGVSLEDAATALGKSMVAIRSLKARALVGLEDRLSGLVWGNWSRHERKDRPGGKE